MGSRSLTWIGMILGSLVGGFVPLLWGGDTFSLSSIAFSGIGGLLGIYLGYRLSH
ncbi:MAG: hypothetical protein Q7S84_02625 [bacterium]|nr:hypothetical protein [bacterium]